MHVPVVTWRRKHWRPSQQPCPFGPCLSKPDLMTASIAALDRFFRRGHLEALTRTLSRALGHLGQENKRVWFPSRTSIPEAATVGALPQVADVEGRHCWVDVGKAQVRIARALEFRPSSCSRACMRYHAYISLHMHTYIARKKSRDGERERHRMLSSLAKRHSSKLCWLLHRFFLCPCVTVRAHKAIMTISECDQVETAYVNTGSTCKLRR